MFGRDVAIEPVNQQPITSLYKILELEDFANIENVRAAYKKLALRFHPDKDGDTAKFQEISHAHFVLSDKTRKEKYDGLLRAGNAKEYEKYCNDTCYDFTDGFVREAEEDLRGATKSGIYPTFARLDQILYFYFYPYLVFFFLPLN